MPALTAKTAKLNFSISFDGLTLYPNFRTPNLLDRLFSCLSDFKEYGLFENCFPDFLSKTDYEKNISRSDDDHDYYHLDNFDYQKTHYHYKFKAPITQQKLIILLDIFHKALLITEKEKNIILENYKKRNLTAFMYLINEFSGINDAKLDAKTIVNYIKTCPDNDILSYLYERLSDPQFNYLRKIENDEIETIYQGTNDAGKLIETSKHWAMIQKAISLQLAKNIKDRCGKFSEKVAKDRSQQLQTAYPFFALKRKTPFCSQMFTSSFFVAFNQKQEVEFENKYKKFFGKF